MKAKAAPELRRLFSKKLDFAKGLVELTHGAGGKASAQLFEELFQPAFSNSALNKGDDGAQCPGAERLVVATDSHVVSPLFFPGGDIGALAVHGTVNDVAMAGGIPQYLTVGFIVEEGFPLSDLRRITQSMANAADEACVTIVAGDTKVVERGKGDGVFINTTGVGFIPEELAAPPSAVKAKVGDVILLSGSVGDHGVTILAAREALPLSAPIKSDTAPLNGLAAKLLAEVNGVRTLRDPTRGGLATAINEICRSSGTGALLKEDAIPIRRPVDAACELLGVDPLYLANEGKMIAIVDPDSAYEALQVIRAHPLGADAAIIGEIVEDPDNFVQMETAFGGKRLVDWLTGDPLPRIC
ncbi:MAG: hydrogenase expression/formation protein HypE [Pseudomonadota bacterium]